MMKKNHSYTPLELTAVHAIACKSSAHRRGYNRITTTDQKTEPATGGIASGAAAPHCPKKNYQTPLLNRMYYNRCVVVRSMLDSIIRSIESQLSSCWKSNSIQLLVLGAGFELFDLPENISVFLVDLPGITEARSKAESCKPNVHLVAADLRDSDALLESLQRNGFDSSLPAIILLESVLSYIADCHVNSLLRCLHESIAWANILIYDVTIPNTRGGFADYTLKSFQRGNAPLLSARASPLQLCMNLRGNGWKHVCSCSIQRALDIFVEAEKTRVPMLLEPFDEFSALAVLNTQYVVAWAGNNTAQFSSILDIPSELVSEEIDREHREPTTTSDGATSNRLKVLNARIDLLLVRVIATEASRRQGDSIQL